jgi:Mrp family chromosome partitioning ATPase
MSSGSKNGKASVDLPDLVLPAKDGSSFTAFPMSVIHPIRRMISRLSRKEDIPSRIAFTAALRKEGVSYMSLAFASTMAFDLETSVCVVDLNWYWPAEIFTKLPSTGGMSAVLAGDASLEDVLAQTGKPNLAFLPAGNIPINERAYFARSSILKDIILELNSRYDHLVLDVPAVLASNDAIPLASLGTACCLVIQQGATLIDEAKTAFNDLDHIPNLGVIMNKYRLGIPKIIQKAIKPYTNLA